MAELGIIFDMDGVIIDSAEPHRQSWQQLGNENGVVVTAEAFARSFGQSNRSIIPQLFSGVDDEERIRRMSDRKEELYRDIVRGRMPAMPGAAEFIRQCHAFGFKLAIGSSGPPPNIDLTLDELHLRPYFSAIVSGQDVTHGKPDPQVFLMAAEKLNLPPARCIIVEDAPSGVAAARAAGMAVVALCGRAHPTETLADADLIVHAFEELSPKRLADLIES